METGYHFFSIGVGSECYTIVLFGNKEEATQNLKEYFSRVAYIRTENKKRRDWHGNRPLGNCMIHACYFSGMFSPKRSRPLIEPSDMMDAVDMTEVVA